MLNFTVAKMYEVALQDWQRHQTWVRERNSEARRLAQGVTCRGRGVSQYLMLGSEEAFSSSFRDPSLPEVAPPENAPEDSPLRQMTSMRTDEDVKASIEQFDQTELETVAGRGSIGRRG